MSLRTRYGIVAIVLIAGFAGLLPTSKLNAAEKEKEKDAKGAEAGKEEKPAEAPSRVKRGPNGEVIVTLDAATQKLMGLETAAVEPAQLSPEIKAYGRVLDVSSLASLVAELFTAQAA